MEWGLADVEAFAKRVLPKPAYDYAAGGAGAEWTLHENVAAFGKWRLRARFLSDVSQRDLSVSLLGRPLPLPFGVAPTAFHRMFHPDGEVGTASAAAQRGVLYVASTISTTPLEEMAALGGPRWFQLYVHKDRGLTLDLVRRAEAAGYEALVLTVDVPVQGMRWRDRRNRFTLPRGLTVANVGTALSASDGPLDGLSHYIHTQFDPSLTWADFAWLVGKTRLPVLVKGVVTAEDARLAVDHGAAGVIVSNHGARQLDRMQATLDVLPEVVEAVGARVPVLFDGGVRGGLDVLVALALGARFVFLGRQVVWGLAAGGGAGVGRVLDLIRDELDNGLALTGRARIADLDATLLARA